MTEENKYYIPEIEEFHPGFEFEYLTVDDDWQKDIFDSVKPGDHEQMPFDLIKRIFNSDRSKELRVKYLDREDIEGMGFSELTSEDKIKTNCGMVGGTSFKKIVENEKIRITFILQFSGVYMMINKLTERSLRGYNEFFRICFDGKLKNKSELKKVLKQIGI